MSVGVYEPWVRSPYKSVSYNNSLFIVIIPICAVTVLFFQFPTKIFIKIYQYDPSLNDTSIAPASEIQAAATVVFSGECSGLASSAPPDH
jgi:hypothetical protein